MVSELLAKLVSMVSELLAKLVSRVMERLNKPVIQHRVKDCESMSVSSHGHRHRFSTMHESRTSDKVGIHAKGCERPVAVEFEGTCCSLKPYCTGMKRNHEICNVGDLPTSASDTCADMFKASPRFF